MSNQGAGPSDPWGTNRPTTSDGRYVVAYASHAQVREALEGYGFYWSDRRREWHNPATQEAIPKGYELDYLQRRSRFR